MKNLTIEFKTSEEELPSNDKAEYIAICATKDGEPFAAITQMGWILRKWIKQKDGEIIFFIPMSDVQSAVKNLLTNKAQEA